VKFQSKYVERSERMSIRVPLKLKNHIWQEAANTGKSATDVVVDILERSFKGRPAAKRWQPGTTKGGPANDKARKDVFA
jgi:hypothetical protein